MVYFLCIILGITIGAFISLFFAALYMSKKIFGTLKTMYDDGEAYLFLDMDQHPEDIHNNNFVIFRVEKDGKDGPHD